jgi:ABC-type lipoprotein export system ATPase subunit
MNAAVDVRDLFRVYSTPEGDAAALQGLSLAVGEREVLVVLGPSGSGKTTLLRILAGLEPPSAGFVRVFGADVARLAGSRLASYRSSTLGYVDQHYNRALTPELSARQVVALQLALTGAAHKVRLARADELLERVGLFDRRDARPAELSGGEQQRIAVCAALAHRPRLLLADEPTGELDAASAALVYKVIGELARDEGCTTMVVSHDPESAAIADRIVRIRDGRVSEEAPLGGGTEETLVVGRGGWLRLPEDLLLRAGISSRALVRFDERGILVSAAEPRAAAAAEPKWRDVDRGARGEGSIVAETRGLAKIFGRRQSRATVFKDLNVSFETGKLTVVTGPSGSGKTTLLHLLAGLEEPSAGEVIVLGNRVNGLPRAERANFRRRHVALVGQDPGLAPFLSARENVELALALRGVPSEEAGERSVDALGAVGLAERAEQRVSRLSAGERERTAIARALAVRPSLLLADEPTSRLDQANSVAVASLFARLAGEVGTAIVCATHDPLVVEQADATLLLDGYAPERPTARRRMSRRPR